jgi:hypothetical protein
VSLIQALQNYLVVTAAIATVVGAVRFLDGRRLKVTVRGGPEVVHDQAAVGPREAFVFYVVNDRDHPVTLEACGIIAQDTAGNYWRLNAGLPDSGVAITRGVPYRLVLPFGDVATHGLDVERRLYAFARIAQPARDILSRRTAAGPSRGPIPRPRPTPRARPAGLSPIVLPWRARLLP